MKELSVFLFLLFSLSGHGKSETMQSRKYIYSLRLNWQMNLKAEAGIGNHFTLQQGIGPSYNIIGYGANIEFDSELIDVYEQLTYFGGLRYYLSKQSSQRFYSRGFDGLFLGLHYALSIDGRSGSFTGLRPPGNYVLEMNCVGVFFGWQTSIGRRFYGNVALGIGQNTFFGYYSAGPLSQLEFGWRFWEPSFKD